MGRGGEGNRRKEGEKRKYVHESQGSSAEAAGGSRSVRKWSFNGLPSRRQICHLRLLGGSPRAFHLLITSFQPAPSIPCPSSARPPGWRPHRYLAPFSGGGCQGQRGAGGSEPCPEQTQDPGLHPPAWGCNLLKPACSPAPRVGKTVPGSHHLAPQLPPEGKGEAWKNILSFSTLYTFYFTNIIMSCLHNNFVFFPFYLNLLVHLLICSFPLSAVPQPFK